MDYTELTAYHEAGHMAMAAMLGSRDSSAALMSKQLNDNATERGSARALSAPMIILEDTLVQDAISLLGDTKGMELIAVNAQAHILTLSAGPIAQAISTGVEHDAFAFERHGGGDPSIDTSDIYWIHEISQCLCDLTQQTLMVHLDSNVIPPVYEALRDPIVWPVVKVLAETLIGNPSERVSEEIFCEITQDIFMMMELGQVHSELFVQFNDDLKSREAR